MAELLKRLNIFNKGQEQQGPAQPQKTDKKIFRTRTHLSTDKPIYKAGETVYVRGVVVDGITDQPIIDSKVPGYDPHGLEPHLEIIAPSGDKVFQSVLQDPRSGTIAAQWVIPQGQAGGDYKIKVSYPHDEGCATAERAFNIRAYRPPRLKTQLIFVKKAYGEGETAVAILDVKRAEGGVPEGASVEAIARIDGEEIFRGSFQVNKEGICRVEFQLPDQIRVGEGTLTCVVQDGGVVETASKTIPIILKAMDVRIYPEGGELVSGLECGLYIEGFTKSGDPADITAEIWDTEKVAEIQTLHEGRGKTSFVPGNKEYHLRIVKPQGVTEPIPLPRVIKSGVSLRATKDVYKFEEELKVKLQVSEKGEYVVSLNKIDKEVSKTSVQLKEKEARELVLKTDDSVGVLRVTVFKDKKPLAERLVFRAPKDKLCISLEVDNQNYTPGDSVKLTIRTTDSSGAAVSAFVGVTVTDDAILEMVEKRKQAPRLPAMIFLENEVDHLEDAQFYFDPEEKDADLAVDLLLGTQGWRRFVFQNPEKFLAEKGEVAERVLVSHKSKPREVIIRRGPVKKGKRKKMKEEVKFKKRDFNEEAEMKRQEMIEEDFSEEEMDMEAEEVAGPVQPVIEEKAEMIMDDDAPQQLEAPKVMDFEEEEEEEEEMEAKIEMKQMKRDMMMEEEKAARAKKKKAKVIPVTRYAERTKYAREFAHKIRPGRQPGDRVDFTETLYWCACIRTNNNGVTSVTFDLNDSVTSFKAIADGYTQAGLIGSSQILIESKQPFYVEPKMPLEITSGDTVEIPVALVNATKQQLNGKLIHEIRGKTLSITDSANDFVLQGEERVRKILHAKVGDGAETTSLVLNATGEPFSDAVTRMVKVVPRGFPISVGAGGILKPNSKVQHEIVIPEDFIPASASTSVSICPRPLASLTESLKLLIKEPYGCFEQTSMTTYPLVMAQQYFKGHDGVDPELITRANEMLEKGYKRLIGYECKSGTIDWNVQVLMPAGGFDWFGQDPGHEALTAYGIMQFVDMSKVMEVDQKMLERTKTWLMARRNGKGGFERNSRALDHFGGAPEWTTNAYIVWSLTEAGMSLEMELAAVVEECRKNDKDPYIIGLTAASLYTLKRTSEAEEFAEKLVQFQQPDGMVTSAVSTITCSSGNAKDIETTAIAIMVWTKSSKFEANALKGGEAMMNFCKGGSFYNTQATVLALKAIIALDNENAKPAEGSVIARLDGEEVGSEGFSPYSSGAITLPSFADKVTPGKHILELEMMEGSKMPYSFAIDFSVTKGENSSECAVSLTTKASHTEIKEGEGAEIQVTLSNTKDKALPMTICIIGLPGGVDPRHEQLKELVSSKVVDYYEVFGAREVVLYWRTLAPKEVKTFKVDMIASIPGSYTGPASRAYLYYTNEHKVWNEGIHITIVPKN